MDDFEEFYNTVGGELNEEPQLPLAVFIPLSIFLEYFPNFEYPKIGDVTVHDGVVVDISESVVLYYDGVVELQYDEDDNYGRIGDWARQQLDDIETVRKLIEIYS